MNIQTMADTGIKSGLVIAAVPAAVTALIACSKIIAVNIIANIAVRILTFGRFGVSITGIGFVPVPLLWKISLISAAVGGSITALSLVAALADSVYRRFFSHA